MIAGTLEIRLMAEMASLKRGMDEANRTVTGAMSRIESATATAARALGAFGGTLAVGAIVNGLNKVYDSLAELDDMAQKTGASVESLSRLQKVANITGTEFGKVDDALVKLAKGMATADSETNKAQAALRAIGVSAKDASGKLRDPGEVLTDVARRLQLYNDGAAKAALMNDLLGKSGAQLLPYLNDISQFYGRVTPESTRAAQAAAELGDTWGMLKQRAADVGSQLAVQLLPALQGVASAMADSGSRAGGLGSSFAWLGDTLSFLIKAFAVFGFAIKTTFEQIAAGLAAVIATMVKLANLDFSGALAVGRAWKADAIGINDEWKKALDTILNGKKELENGGAGKMALDYISGEKAEKASRAKEVKDQLSDYQKLSFELSKVTAERYKSILAGRELTPVEKQLSDLASSIADGSKKMTAGEFAAAQAMIQEAGAVGQLVDEQKKLIDARQKISEIMGQSQVEEMDRLARVELETQLVGKSAREQALLRAEYEANLRLQRTIGEIAKAAADGKNGLISDPEEEARTIAKMKAESDARIQIIKDEELAKARTAYEGEIYRINQSRQTQEEILTAGTIVAEQVAFTEMQLASTTLNWKLDAIDKLEARQNEHLRNVRQLEEAADQAQFALTDRNEQVRLAEIERIKEINRLRATGEAHNLELADHYAQTLNNRGVMEEAGFAIAKQRYALAAQELETAQKSFEVKDIEAMRMEEMIRFQKILDDLRDLSNTENAVRHYGEMAIEEDKKKQVEHAANEFILLEKQIKAGGDIAAIKQEQLKLAKEIAFYTSEAAVGMEAQQSAAAASAENLRKEQERINEQFDQRRWADRINSFEQDLRTSWLRLLDHNTQSWNAFIKGLLHSFKTSLFNEIYRMLVKPFTFKIIASIVGLTGSGAASASVDKLLDGAISEAGIDKSFKTMDWLTVGKTIYSGLSGGFSSLAATTTEGFWHLGWALKDAGFADAAEALWGASGNLGIAASYIGAAAAGISIGTLLAGDKSVLGMDGLTTSSIGSIVGAIFGGPIGALAGGIIGGAVNAIFGMGEKRYGPTNVVGSFSGSGFTGNLQSEWTQKGGLLRSNKSGVTSQDLTQKAQDTLNGITLGVGTAFGRLLSVTGEAARSLDGWTFAIKRQLDTEEAMKALIHDLGNSMGEFLIPEIKNLQKEGESLADTAIRLTDTYIVTQAIYDMLGHSAYQVGLASLKMRDDLVQLFGGLQQTSSAMSAFYSNFFTADEQKANSWRQLDNTFKSLNLTTPQTREEFRALAEAQDLTTEEGRLLFVALMQIAPAFAAVTDPIEDVTKALADLAAAAAQAMNSIASSLDQMRGTNVASQFQAQLALNAAMAKVTAAMPWITSWDQLATIQIDDAAQYSDANKILISEAIAAGAALGQLVKTAGDAAKALHDKKIADAFEALRRAVDAEKDRLTKIYNDQAKALNDNISKLRGLSDALGNTLDSINPMSRSAAQAQLASALLLAKTGGIFPTADELSGALRAVSEPSEKLFSNFVDYKRDRAYTTITIESLKKLADNQLSTEELTLKQLEETHTAEMERLDSIISTAQAQIDALNGINNSVLSVAQALANFAAAMGISTTPNSPTSAGTGSSGSGSASMILPNGQFNTSLNGPITRGTYQGLPIGYTEADAGGINWVDGYGNAVDPYAEVQRRIALRQALGIPGFASGGAHSGGWRMVGENGPELEYTPPSRIYSNSQSKDMLNNAEVVAELRELRAELRAGNIAIAGSTGATAKMVKRWEGNGLPVRLADSADPLEVNVVQSVAVPVS